MYIIPIFKGVDLRKLARGMPCLLRIPNVCNHDPETTVLAHVRIPGTGMGRKPTDLAGIWCCEACHSCLDGRVQYANLTRDEIRSMALDGLVRTLEAVARELE